MMDVVRKWNFWINKTTGRKIFGAAMVIASLSLIAKAASTAKEIAIAGSFGAGDTVDSFLMALLVPTCAISVIGGSFCSALIPTYIHVREREGAASAQKLFSNTLAGSLALLSFTTVVMLAAAPFYLPIIASGFSSGKIALTVRLLCLLSPIVILRGINTIWGAVLNADHRFGLVAAAPVITPLIVILFLYSCGTRWGISSLAFGTVCGMLLELSLLGVALVRKGISPWPRWHGLDSNLRQVIRQFLPMISAGLLMSSAGFIDLSMSAMLGSGSVSALSYGSKIISVPLSLTAAALGTAVIPYFSAMVARKEWAEIRRTIRRYFLLIFLTSVPATVLLISVSEPLVQLLFQRGAFTFQNTHLVAQVQSLLALQIPFYIAAMLMVRLISSLLANHILMIGCIINVAVSVSLNYVFMKKMGVGGIALSTSCVYLISFLFLYFSWRWISRNYAYAESVAIPVWKGVPHD